MKVFAFDFVRRGHECEYGPGGGEHRIRPARYCRRLGLGHGGRDPAQFAIGRRVDRAGRRCGDRVRAAGARPELLVAIPGSQSGTSRRFIRSLDPSGRLVSLRQTPALRWRAGPIVNDTGRWTLEGDPRGWFATCEPDQLRRRILVLANGNPGAYARILRNSQPSYAAIDIDGNWVASQSPGLRHCLQRVQLVTITRREHARLPPEIFSGTGIGQRQGAMLAIKSGPAGSKSSPKADAKCCPHRS